MGRVERRDKHHPHLISNLIMIEGRSLGRGRGDSKGYNNRG